MGLLGYCGDSLFTRETYSTPHPTPPVLGLLSVTVRNHFSHLSHEITKSSAKWIRRQSRMIELDVIKLEPGMVNSVRSHTESEALVHDASESVPASKNPSFSGSWIDVTLKRLRCVPWKRKASKCVQVSRCAPASCGVRRNVSRSSETRITSEYG